jgi:hypothetical protein
MLKTWNDYKDATAVERGMTNCGKANQRISTTASTSAPAISPGSE